MKPGILLGVVVALVLLSQAGIGYLAFKNESKEEALAEMQRHEQGRIEKLRALAAETETELERLRPRKASLDGELASLKKQVEEVGVELEEKRSKVHQLQAEEKRLAGITDESKRSTEKLASLEAASTEAQKGLEARQKEAALLEAKVRRLMDDFEKLTKNSAFLETAESRVTLKRASGDLESSEKQKSSWEKEFDVRWRDFGALDRRNLKQEEKERRDDQK
jgi:chromosome segregation ATPase